MTASIARVTDSTLASFCEAVEMLRRLDAGMIVPVLSTLLYVASQDGCSKAWLEQDLGLTNSSGPRNTQFLATSSKTGKTPLRLIEGSVCLLT